MNNLYSFNTYKEFLKDLIKCNSEKRGYQASLARAAGCQPSYISQVLSGKAELLLDHAAGISDFLGLNSAETDYLLTLVQLARATSLQLKSVLHKKLQILKEKQFELKEQIPNLKTTQSEIEGVYYSSWIWTAVHIATSINKYQTAESLSQRLGVPLHEIKEVLRKLEEFQYIRSQKETYFYHQGASHLPRESVMNEMNHLHWRARSIFDLQKKQNNSLNYTSVFSMAKTDSDNLRKALIQTINDSRQIIAPSQPEELYCFNIDFFMV